MTGRPLLHPTHHPSCPARKRTSPLSTCTCRAIPVVDLTGLVQALYKQAEDFRVMAEQAKQASDAMEALAIVLDGSSTQADEVPRVR